MSPLYLDPHLYDAIWVQSEHYHVPYHLIAAILQQESGFNPLAIGDSMRSFGLGQVNLDGAGAGQDPSRLLEIDYNLEIAVAYLRSCLDAYPEELPRAIAAYNRGIAGASEVPDPLQLPYVQNVLSWYSLYQDVGIERHKPWSTMVG